jgi:hypothetical protein
MIPKALRTINKTRKKKARKRKSVEGDPGSLLFAFNVECACLKVACAVRSIFAFLCLLKEKKKVQESSS